MKCIGKENPPCNRCRQSGHICTFDGPRKTKGSKVEDRLKVVEAQMGALQSTMEELIRLQRGATVGGPALTTGLSPLHRVPPDPISFQYTPPAAQSTPGTLLSMDSLFDPGSGPAPATQRPPVNKEKILEQRPWARPPTPPKPGGPIREEEDDEDKDPLNPSTGNAPWDNMLSLAEAARLKADGHPEEPVERYAEVARTGKRKVEEKIYPSTAPLGSSKRQKKQVGTAADGSLNKSSLANGSSTYRKNFKNPVELGWCTEEKGRQLYKSFIDHCLMFIPIFDPEVDTWESLCERSSFCITAILYVGAKVEDAAKQESELQRKCREHAEKIGMTTLFTPIARIEIVQAMIIMASWGDTSWRPGGHALRIAMDMGLYRCLPYLAQSGMGQNKPVDQIRADYPMVVGARVWLQLFRMDLEMAFNFGRPAFITGEITIRYARQFLEHPLSIPADARLSSSVELFTFRTGLYQPFSILPPSLALPDLDEKLMQARVLTNQWFTYWDQYLRDRGIPPTDLLRENLVTGRAGAFMYTNSRILYGVRNKFDIARMSDQRKEFLIIAIRAAEKILSICLRGGDYNDNFKWANIYTHVGAAFAARLLIRMANLLPEVLDVRQVSRDVDRVSLRLTEEVPSFQVATMLRDVLQRARSNRILPPLSKAPSPVKENTVLPSTDLNPTLPQMTAEATAAGPISASDFNFNDLDAITSNFDFTYADQLFSNSGRPAGPSETLTFPSELPGVTGEITDPDSFMDLWFPFPPLESDGTQGITTLTSHTPQLPQSLGQLQTDARRAGLPGASEVDHSGQLSWW